MLVVPRKEGQNLIIKMGDFDIVVAFLGMEDNRARIGVEAPREFDIIRGEHERKNPRETSTRFRSKP